MTINGFRNFGPRRSAVWGLFLTAALLALPAMAQGSNSRNSLGLPIDPALLSELPERKGVVSWSVLGQVKSSTAGGKVVPEFAAPIVALDKRNIKVQGFMLPIVTGETHTHFLLTMRPPHCPFCLSIGPEYVVEVRTKAPIKHSVEPIVVAGTFAVLRDDPFGLYYRLTAAELASAEAQ
jgi:hypothetical protein